MAVEKIEMNKDAVCPICREKYLTEELAEGERRVVKQIVKSATFGLAHTACYMPYCKEETIKILLRVYCYSLGDTITSTPVVREVRRLYPKAQIVVATLYPDVFKHNPFINGIVDLNLGYPSPEYEGSFQFSMNMFDTIKMPCHFSIHSVEFSALCALDRSLYPTQWNTDLLYAKEDKEEALKIAKDHGIDYENDKLLLIHPHGTEWPTRDWGPHHFPALAKKLQAKYPDYKLVSVGGKRSEVPKHEMKNYVPIEGAIDLYGKMTLLQTAAFMDSPACKLMITPDTGALHIAATRSELPIVGIFTLIKSYFRTPVRAGRFAYKFIGVESADPCNCTYNSRFLTNEGDFFHCPKRSFLEKTQRNNVPQELKKEGLSAIFPEDDWNTDDAKLGALIRKKIDHFEPTKLPCFPAVDRVMLAVERALNEFG